MSGQHLGIGLLAATEAQLDLLDELARRNNLLPVDRFLLQTLQSEPACLLGSDAEAWLVTVDIATAADEGLDQWLTLLPHAVIIDDIDNMEPSAADHGSWLRRIEDKLRHLQGNINLSSEPSAAARQVWVLAASTGGQDAVRQFLRALPSNLGLGFIYLQHSAGREQESTVMAMSRQGRYPAYAAEHGTVIKANRTAVIASEQMVEVATNGTFLLRPGRWPGRYSPSFDQVFANIARVYRRNCGVIAFSGTGDDGAMGVRLVHQQGGQVWVQTPSSCVAGAMPEAILETQLVHQMGTPTGLATQLSRYCVR